MGYWNLRHRWPIAIAAILVISLAVVATIAAQPPVPHATMAGDDCLSCHQSGVGGAPRVAWDHLGRSNEDCELCHDVSSAPLTGIPHTIVGRDDCLSCHREGIGSTPMLGGSHVDYTNDDCLRCHVPSVIEEPEPPADATPIPTAEPGGGVIHPGESTCVSCHQMIFADEEHALFTGQPMGSTQTGEQLFAQLCSTCHGEDGTTPVGEEGVVINDTAYWSVNDDSAILRDIGMGTHGEMTAFVQDYGGPLSWEEVLDLAAYVRTWGPVAAPPIGTPSGALTYADTIGPLLTERCGSCHGGIAGLTVTDYGSLIAGSQTGAVVVPGDPQGSKIVEVQLGEHYAQLSQAELDLLIEWIASGASDQ